MTRRAIVQKWILYCLCALVLLAVQDLILVRIRIGGVHPFLLPALAVIPVTLERSGQSLLYALFFGLACDLLMPTGVFVCFYRSVNPSGSRRRSSRSCCPVRSSWRDFSARWQRTPWACCCAGFCRSCCGRTSRASPPVRR